MGQEGRSIVHKFVMFWCLESKNEINPIKSWNVLNIAGDLWYCLTGCTDHLVLIQSILAASWKKNVVELPTQNPALYSLANKLNPIANVDHQNSNDRILKREEKKESRKEFYWGSVDIELRPCLAASLLMVSLQPKDWFHSRDKNYYSLPSFLSQIQDCRKLILIMLTSL